MVDELTGHEGEGTSQTVYLHDFPLKVLAEAIAKVEWKEVDLSSLYTDSDCPRDVV